MSYTKLFHRIITSSMWDEPDQTRIVWITMLAMANQDGYVGATKKSLALLARVPEEACEKALQTFLAPDPESRSKEHDGRRIEEVDGGWRLLTYEKHRDSVSDDPSAIANRERQRRYRESLRNVTSRDPAYACASSSASALERGPGETWRTSYAVYQAEEQAAYDAIRKDEEWIAAQERLNPGIDVRLSIEKAHVNYWSTEEAWLWKKTGKVKKINWKSTFGKTIDKNKAWKPRQPRNTGLPELAPGIGD